MNKGIYKALLSVTIAGTMLSGCINKNSNVDNGLVDENKTMYQVKETITEPIKEKIITREDVALNNAPIKNDKNKNAVQPKDNEKVKKDKKPEQSKEDLLKQVENLSNEKLSWSWKRNKENKSPIAYVDMDLLSKYQGYYLGDTDKKVIYLTFDNGYENGFTGGILDTLKDKGVKASFFLTKAYIRDNKELVIRMKEEGHILGNHTVTHPSLPDKSSEEVYNEIKDVEKYMLETTGFKIDTYFRPPRGEFSERTLAITKGLGYKSIFWSMAYKDWLVDEQPGKDFAVEHIITNAHPGMIPLLHAVSSSNAEALGEVIDALKADGYEFHSLDQMPQK